MVGSEAAAFNSVWRQLGDSSTSEGFAGRAQGTSAPREGGWIPHSCVGAAPAAAGAVGGFSAPGAHVGDRSQLAPLCTKLTEIPVPQPVPSILTLPVCHPGLAVPSGLPRALAPTQPAGDLQPQRQTAQGGNTSTATAYPTSHC